MTYELRKSKDYIGEKLIALVIQMKLYGLKSCDKCRAAHKALREAGEQVTYIDVRADGVSVETLQQFFTSLGEDIVNRRSTTWRNLSEEERGGDVVPLLTANPTLMKRPVIEVDGELLLGWGKDVQARLLG